MRPDVHRYPVTVRPAETKYRRTLPVFVDRGIFHVVDVNRIGIDTAQLEEFYRRYVEDEESVLVPMSEATER